MFERFYVNSLGQMLLAKAQVGTLLTFTRVRIGDGTLPGGQSIEALTDLISPIKYLPIASLSSRDQSAIITSQFSNSDLDTSFWFREIGLYATDPDNGEILYAYANAGDKADHIPAASTSPVDFTFSFNLSVGNAENVTVVADPSLIFMTQEDFAEITEDEIDGLWDSASGTGA